MVKEIDEECERAFSGKSRYFLTRSLATICEMLKQKIIYYFMKNPLKRQNARRNCVYESSRFGYGLFYEMCSGIHQ